jgi:hypothetical protein
MWAVETLPQMAYFDSPSKGAYAGGPYAWQPQMHAQGFQPPGSQRL